MDQPPAITPLQRSIKGWVILATNTGVGKTWVGCGLIAALRAHGACVRVRKPVETGCQAPLPANKTEHPERIPADATALWQAAGQIEPLSDVCPWRFSAAIAAPQAATREGKTLYFAADIAPHLPAPEAAHALGHPPEYWIIEGAGGVLSPLTEDGLNVELARYTALPVLLIAPDTLGTQSALFCAIEALHQRGIVLAGIVLNAGAVPLKAVAPLALDNQAALQTWLPRLMPNTPPPPIFKVRNPDDLRQLADHLTTNEFAPPRALVNLGLTY
ncbi:MAG: dethiobiotin synthase [Halothiobacillus sp.]